MKKEILILILLFLIFGCSQKELGKSVKQNKDANTDRGEGFNDADCCGRLDYHSSRNIVLDEDASILGMVNFDNLEDVDDARAMLVFETNNSYGGFIRIEQGRWGSEGNNRDFNAIMVGNNTEYITILSSATDTGIGLRSPYNNIIIDIDDPLGGRLASITDDTGVVVEHWLRWTNTTRRWEFKDPVAINNGNLTIEDGDIVMNGAASNIYTKNVIISADNLLKMVENMTAKTCDETNRGSILYSANKHYGCDGMNWNAMY